MTKKNNKPTPAEAIQVLKDRYPDAQCALQYEADPWKLLVMARLSAQCTDARVNLICKDLFRAFPDARTMAQGDVHEIENLIRSCGFFRMKAQNLKDSSRMLLEKFDGAIPDTMEELLMLPGVGRKIANLMLGDIYHKPAIVADTHCIRLSNRMGFADSKDPHKVELALKKIIPPQEQSDFCHRLVMFGREICTAQRPKCDLCPFPCKQPEKTSKKGEKHD